MTAWGPAALIAVAVILFLPCLVLFVQCLIAVFPCRDRFASAKCARPRVGVLVPAHNEETVLHSTLQSILSQLVPGDRLLVVADNCSDATARIAREMGGEVLERNDPMRRGKGYALQAGLDRFREQPPEVVIVIDADCRLLAGCVEALAIRVATTARPAQACYLMTPPRVSRTIDVVSSLAVLVKNRVRPLGMAKMGLPCLITGSGSAFPWAALEVRSFAPDNIVEDMQLAIDLALAGFAPTYCDHAQVLAGLPDQHQAFVSQRRRWEHGHLQTLATQVPRLLGGFIKTGRADLAAMMFDLAVPPLSLLAFSIMLSLGIALVGAAFGAGWTPAAIAAGGGVLLAASTILAWWQFARDRIPLFDLLSVPVYIASKLPLYATFLFRRERSWVRTSRASQSERTLD